MRAQEQTNRESARARPTPPLCVASPALAAKMVIPPEPACALSANWNEARK